MGDPDEKATVSGLPESVYVYITVSPKMLDLNYVSCPPNILYPRIPPLYMIPCFILTYNEVKIIIDPIKKNTPIRI